MGRKGFVGQVRMSGCFGLEDSEDEAWDTEMAM